MRGVLAPVAVATSVVVATCIVVAAGTSAGAAPPLPTPGSAKEIARLVTQAPSSTGLPAHLDPPLGEVAGDGPGAYYPPAAHACQGLSACVFGKAKGATLVVLFGDSHAQMWLPALAPVAAAFGWRLALVWRPGCPAADVSVWEAATHSVNAACNAFRAAALTAIAAAHPALVLLASRTADIPGPGNRPISQATWQAGLASTIDAVASKTTRVAVIGDVTAFGAAVPLPACVAANPHAVQRCEVRNPNPRAPSHVAAERAAATATGAAYLDPQPWLCSAVCTPIVGNLFVYADSYHVDATYAEFLSGVWRQLLKKDGLVPSTGS